MRGKKASNQGGKARRRRANRLTLNIEEAAAILGISRNGGYEAVKRGEIPVIEIGKRKLVTVAWLEAKLGRALPTDEETAVA